MFPICRRVEPACPEPEIDIDLKKLLRALQSVRDGDFSVRLPSDQTGIGGKIADTFNEIIASNQRVAVPARGVRWKAR